MARRKKKEGSSIPEEKLARVLVSEEKLAQALVPDIGQPYKVPENWCWVRQSVICSLVDGQKTDGKYYPYWEVKALRGTKDTQYVSEGKFVNKGTKVILVDGENSGEVFDIPEDGYMGSTFKALQIDTVVNWDYLRFFITTKQELYRNNKKGSAIPHLNKELFFNMPFPLAPCAEQQRIVERIEVLFAKLDEAKTKTQAVLDSFETRKSSILHKAFSGELTAKWREAHGLGMDSWVPTSSSQLFSYVTSGSRGWAQYYADDGAAFIRMGNLDHGSIELDLTDIQYVQLPDKAEGQRSLIQKNDILISITADVGMIGLVRDIDFEGYINQHVALARPTLPESAEFIAWYLVSDVGLQQFRNKQRGATKTGLGLNDIRTLSLYMPTLSEQAEIVRLLDSLFAKEQQSKEAAELALKEIDLIKESILFRAFRGELGTNDPTEASAVELIKQLLSENIAIKKPKIPRVRKKPEVAFVAKTIMQALVEKGKTTPEKLKAETDLQIDDFYDQLKDLIDNGQVVETRVDGEAYLEAENADRQPNN